MAANQSDEVTGIDVLTGRRLTRLPPIGFWSYSRQDDDLSKGRLSNLRGLLMSELQQQYGRDRVQVFQDVSAIPHGAAWEQEIRTSLHEASFFIPIVTPNFIQSEWCCAEVRIFLERERQLLADHPDLPRRSRIFPLQLIDITGIEAHDANVLVALEQLQWFDFRAMRHRRLDDESVQHALSDFAVSIRDLLQARIRPLPTKEELERAAADAAAARAREEEAATALRVRQEAERVEREAGEARLEAARAGAARAAEASRIADAAALAEAERQTLTARAEAERLAAERAEAERRAAAERAEHERLLRQEAAARRAERGPLIRRLALVTIAVSLLVIAGVLLLTLRGGDKASEKSAGADADLPPAPQRETPAGPAPVLPATPAHAWLAGRWGIAGSCASPRTITTPANRIVMRWSGGRQVERVATADARSITTDLTTYTRDGTAVNATERAVAYTYRMTPCPR